MAAVQGSPVGETGRPVVNSRRSRIWDPPYTGPQYLAHTAPLWRFEPPRVSRRLVCLSPGRSGWDMLTIAEVFKLCCRDMAEFAEQATVVEPVDPFEGGEFEVVETPPRP